METNGSITVAVDGVWACVVGRCVSMIDVDVISAVEGMCAVVGGGVVVDAGERFLPVAECVV